MDADTSMPDAFAPDAFAPDAPFPVPFPVLVVDDDADIRQAIRDALELVGCAVLEAAGVEEAMGVLRGLGGPCVVLLDFLMPGLDGTALLERVAAAPDWRRVAVVCATASPTRLSDAFAALAGRLGVPVVGKPFDLDALHAAVAAAEAALRARQATARPACSSTDR